MPSEVKSNKKRNIIIISIVVVFIIIIVTVLLYYFNNCDETFENNADVHLSMNPKPIKRIEHKAFKSFKDYFRLGVLNQFTLNKPLIAEDYYITTLRKLKKHGTDAEKVYYANKIKDYLNVDDPEIKTVNKREIFKLSDELIISVDKKNDEKKKLEQKIQRRVNPQERLHDKIERKVREADPRFQNFMNVTQRYRRDNFFELTDVNIEEQKMIEQYLGMVNRSPEKTIRWHVDPQNVHDPLITADMKNTIQILKGHYKVPISDNETIRYIKMYVHENPDLVELYKINAALNSIQQNFPLYQDGPREMEILKLVLNRVKQLRNPEIERTFITNLGDCVHSEAVIPHCVGGRVARLLSTFAHMDSEHPTMGILKTKEALRNEMLTTAAQIQKNILNEVSHDLKSKYNEGKSDQEVVLLTKKIKDTIEHEIRNSYPVEYQEYLIKEMSYAF